MHIDRVIHPESCCGSNDYSPFLRIWIDIRVNLFFKFLLNFSILLPNMNLCGHHAPGNHTCNPFSAVKVVIIFAAKHKHSISAPPPQKKKKMCRVVKTYITAAANNFFSKVLWTPRGMFTHLTCTMGNTKHVNSKIIVEKLVHYKITLKYNYFMLGSNHNVFTCHNCNLSITLNLYNLQAS